MSVFCPKCQKRTYNEYICDHCQYEIKKDHSIPKTKHAFSIKREFSQNPLLVIIAIGITILSLIGIYFAYDKYRERKELEKAIEYMSGYKNADEYYNATPKERMKKLNESKMMKDTGIILDESMKKTDETMKNMFKKM